MSGPDPVAIVLVMILLAAFVGYAVGVDSRQGDVREKFLTFCTSQNIPYAKCKEEWEKP